MEHLSFSAKADEVAAQADKSIAKLGMSDEQGSAASHVRLV